MARSKVKVDYRELEKLRDRIEKLDRSEEFYRECARELAARLLAKVIKRTPVGVYAHRTGGTLRRGWTAQSQSEAESGHSTPAKEWADSLAVNKVGSDYIIEVVNPVEYASYVEYGHRTADHTGWVEGQFFLTISEKELQTSAPAIIEKKLNDYLKRTLL